MLLYISATNQVVSAVLVVERDMDGHKLRVQRLIYYIFEVLTPCKTRYPYYQKMPMQSSWLLGNCGTTFKSAPLQ